MMNLIVAVDENWGIGKNGGLLAHLPEDMRFFTRMTTESVIIMGRKTLESFPKGSPLKNRVNIVITGNAEYTADGAVICHSLDEAVEAAKSYAPKEVFVIGGAEIYNSMLKFCSRAYVTKIDADLKADVFIKNFDDMPQWKCVFEDKPIENNGIKFRFCTYERK